MLFTDPVFIFIFFPLIIGGFHLINKYSSNFALLFLTLSSVIFYSWDQPQFIFLLLFVLVVSWLMGNLISISNNNKKGLLVISIALMLLPLIYYKYFYFIVSNVDENLMPDSIVVAAKSIILPIGISFYTFQAISYLVDVYRGQIKGNGNFIKYSAYITMFPQLVAGPIVRFKEISKQLAMPKISRDDIRIGTYFFIIGLSKKVLIADSLAPIVDLVFDGGTDNVYNFYIILIATIAYALQLYFDFSGYSEMAIGIGRLLGFKFPQNFNSPYKAISLTEFWRRWHMTLTFWIRDYVYIPMGGNRKGVFRRYTNIIFTMLIFGMWHGAGWNFVLWGCGHGAALVFENIIFSNVKTTMTKTIRIISTFSVILLLWIPFRSPDIQTTFIMWNSLTDFEIEKIFYVITLIDLKVALSLLVIPLSLYLVFFKKNTYQMNKVLSLNSSLLLSSLLVFSLFVMLSRPYIPFLYFQF
jgi:alginate O-acetyltransferase complex protein AlgI